MFFKKVLAKVMAVGVVASVGVIGASSPAHAVGATTRIEVHYTSTNADVRWTVVSDATSYYVEPSKDGFYGPWRIWTTNSATTQVLIPLNQHPYQTSQGAYRYKVVSKNSAGTASRSVVLNKSQGSGVYAASNNQAGANKATGCIKEGLKAGLTTTGAAGVYAVGAAWIPGVNAVSAGAVGLAIGGSAGAAYVVCLLPW